jgi:copper transport protein
MTVDDRVRTKPGRRLLAVLGIVAGFLLLFTGVASAHAELIETNPGNGAHLDRAPRQVTLKFSETVGPVRGGFSVVDGSGRTVASPAAAGSGPTVTLPLPNSLGDGVYVVNWRVVSADSHPVHGAFVFSVGSAQAAPLGDAGAQSGSDSGVGFAFWLFRLLGYASLAVMIGGSFFVAACWPAGRPDAGVHRLIRTAWLAAIVAAAGSLALQGAYAAGTSLPTAFDPGLLSDTLSTATGIMLAVRLVLLVGSGYVLLRLVRSARPETLSRQQIAVFGGLGVALAATWSGAGHPAAAGGMIWAAFPLDIAHLAAVSVWLGGLVVLAGWTLRRGGSVGEDEAADAVTRYSRAAAVAVAVLGATGLLQAWREIAASGVGGEYFSLLVFKVGAFGLLLWLAAMSRGAVRDRVTAAAGSRRGVARKVQRDMLSRLRTSVRWEVGIAGVVLALTAALVATPPGGHDHGPAAVAATASTDLPATQTLTLPGGDVQVWMDPAHTGANQLVLNVRDTKGIDRDVPEVTAELRLPANNIGPLPVALSKKAAGQYVASGVQIPVAGRWQLTVKVRANEFDSNSVDALLQVR